MERKVQKKPKNTIIRAAKKLFLSAFVTLSFIAYALQNRSTAETAPVPVTDGTDPSTVGLTLNAGPTAVAATALPPSLATQTSATNTATPQATPTKAAPATASGAYKDGTYTGNTVFVNFGYVQVQATVQNGKLTYVQFLQYPSDRRTSQRINATANPILQQEAVQAQSASVQIVTGATLTSLGFQRSLQNALNQAKG